MVWPADQSQRNRADGVPHRPAQALATGTATRELIQHGPYAFVRHPIYLSYWLVFAAVILVYRTWTPLILLAMTLASFSRRARQEEIALAERFGEEWNAYAARVPIFLPRWRKLLQ